MTSQKHAFYIQHKDGRFFAGTQWGFEKDKAFMFGTHKDALRMVDALNLVSNGFSLVRADLNPVCFIHEVAKEQSPEKPQ